MKILVKCILLFLFSFPLSADVAKCVDDYNKAIKERQNAKGAYQTAINYKTRAESYTEKKDNKKLYPKSLEWIKVAIVTLARARRLLEEVKIGGCPESLKENANSLNIKLINDTAVYDSLRIELERKISMLR